MCFKLKVEPGMKREKFVLFQSSETINYSNDALSFITTDDVSLEQE